MSAVGIGFGGDFHYANVRARRYAACLARQQQEHTHRFAISVRQHITLDPAAGRGAFDHYAH